MIGGNTFYGESDAWKYCINNNKWSEFKLNNGLKNVRFHRNCIYNEYIIIYGGIGTSNDIFVYNIKLNKWTVISDIKCQPKSRYGHGMVIHNNMLFIHGGKSTTDNMEALLGDSYMISINDIIQYTHSNSTTLSWIKIEFDMGLLTSNTMISNGQYLYSFGGKNGDMNRTNTLYIYNNIIPLNNNSFSNIIHGFSHNINIPHGITEIIQQFYGINNFMHYKRNKMSTIHKRGSHKGCVISLKNTSYMYIFGGRDINVGVFNDHWLIKLIT